MKRPRSTITIETMKISTTTAFTCTSSTMMMMIRRKRRQQQQQQQIKKGRTIILGMISLLVSNGTGSCQKRTGSMMTHAFMVSPQNSQQQSSSHKYRHHHHHHQHQRSSSSRSIAPFSTSAFTSDTATCLATLLTSTTTTATTTTALNYSVFSDMVHQVPDLSTRMPHFVNPLLLKHMATGGALSFMGDTIAQTLTSIGSKQKKEESSSSPFVEMKETIQSNPVSTFISTEWDQRRTVAMSIFGCLYTGGVQHYIFGFLNNTFDDPITRLLLAQFIFIPFCYYPAFLATVPTLRAGFEPGSETHRNQLTSDILSKLPSTLIRNWMFWLPVQYIQFTYIPTELQVTYCASFGVIWNAILSYSTMTTASKSSKTSASKSTNDAISNETTNTVAVPSSTGVSQQQKFAAQTSITSTASTANNTIDTTTTSERKQQQQQQERQRKKTRQVLGRRISISSSSTSTGIEPSTGTVLFSVARNNMVRTPTAGTKLSDVTTIMNTDIHKELQEF